MWTSHLDTKVVVGVFVLLGLTEALVGVYTRSRRRGDDWAIDLISIGHLAVLVKPTIILSVGAVLDAAFPSARDAWASWPLWLGVPFVMIGDEFLHYWYHRKGHEWSWLWKIHRTHHSTPDLNIVASFRENILWFVLMPNLWYAAALIYFGLGKAYVLSTMVIGVVNVLTHSGLRYDAVLYRTPWLRRVVWIVERVVTLPDTHHAHHGLGRWSSPMGNYATLFIFWDVLFGTASFPHHRPERYGIDDDPLDPWYVQLYWPFIKAQDPKSELAPASIRVEALD